MNAKKTPDEIKTIVLHALHQICPEADLENLAPDAALREELDIDSMDFLRFMLQINQELNVEVPEADYASLATLKGCLEYLNQKMNSP